MFVEVVRGARDERVLCPESVPDGIGPLLWMMQHHTTCVAVLSTSVRSGVTSAVHSEWMLPGSALQQGMAVLAGRPGIHVASEYAISQCVCRCSQQSANRALCCGRQG